VLTVGGARYSGWKTAKVTRGIESIAGSFDLSVSEKWANQDQRWPINDGDECSVSVAGKTVLTGYVDRRETEFDGSSHNVSVSGRDKTGDLVDCSALVDPPQWEFRTVTLKGFVEKICAPFGIPVSLQSGLALPKPPEKYHVDPGATAFNAIEEACRVAGVLPIADGKGGLVLTRGASGRASTSLVEGQNMKSARVSFDSSGRFRRYIALGQQAATDENFGESAAAVRGTAEDPNVTRATRVLIVRPEGSVSAELAKKRAEWEATTRAARAGVVTVTVQGWTQGNGELWAPNLLVPVKSSRMQVDGDMLIVQVTHEVSDSAGTFTTLSLKRPDAFKPEPTGVEPDTHWKEIDKGV
jgi:prophage tail gpP-like protein